jgi:hypothetical protein
MATMWLEDGAHLVGCDIWTDAVVRRCVICALLALHLEWTTMAKTKVKSMVRYLEGLHYIPF